MPLLINSLYFLTILGSVTGLASAADDQDTINHLQEDTNPSSSFELSIRTNSGDPGHPGPLPSYEISTCNIFQDSRYPGIDVHQEGSKDQCVNYCQWLNNNKDEATWKYAFCYGSNITNWTPSGLDQYSVTALGECHCETDPILGFIANLIVEYVVPAIAEISCDIFYTVIHAFVEGLQTFVPGAGEVASAAVQLTAQVAQVILYSIEDKKQQHEAFQKWANSNPTPSLMNEICGQGHIFPNLENAFKTANDIIDQIGLAALFKGIPKDLTWPPPWAKGKGIEGDIEEYLANLGGKYLKRDLVTQKPHLGNVAETKLFPFLKSQKAQETEKPKDSGIPKHTSEPHETSHAPQSTGKSVASQGRSTQQSASTQTKPTRNSVSTQAKSTQLSDSKSTKSPEPTQKTSSATAKSKTSKSEKSHTTEVPNRSETMSDKTSKGEKSSSIERSESAEKSSQSKDSQSSKSPSPTSEKSKPTSSSTMHTSTSEAKTCSKRNSKRAKGGKVDNKCDDDKNHVTSYIVDKMVPHEVVKKIKCPAEYLQACAHYYSAINMGRAQGSFTCETSHRNGGRIKAAQYTNSWSNQHNKKTWKAFTKASLDADGKQSFTLNKDEQYRPVGPFCERDEWPPSYFLPSNDNRDEKKWFQLIRWIPKKDNGGAGRLWRGFCWENDGNIGNGLRMRKRKGLPDEDADGSKQPLILESQDSYNTVPFSSNQIMLKNSEGVENQPQEVKQHLVDLVGKANVDKKTVDGTTHTTSKWAVATFSRAVFTMIWDFPRGEPSQENNYYLKENDCWPADIIPEDPGFVLLTDDPWYKTEQPEFPNAKAFTQMYKKEPPKPRLQAALRNRPDVDLKTLVPKFRYPENFNPFDPNQPPKRKGTGIDNSGQSPPKQQKPTKRDKGAAKNIEERDMDWSTVELVDDRLMVHDATLNATRPLTDREIEEEVQIVHCSDQKCRRELDGINNDEKNILLILPPPLPTIPAVNEAEPTGIISVMAEPITIQRSQPSPELPMVTEVVGAKIGIV